MKAALDTSYILGRGAVKDTYNLLADGVTQVIKALAALDGVKPEEWAKQRGLGRYFGSSVKGEAGVDWDDVKAGRAFLRSIVADADRVLEMARQSRPGEPNGSAREKKIVKAAGLLGQLLLQDVERKEDGAAIKEGVSKDRIPSVHDPEIRHGHKDLFTGEIVGYAMGERMTRNLVCESLLRALSAKRPGKG